MTTSEDKDIAAADLFVQQSVAGNPTKPLWLISLQWLLLIVLLLLFLSQWLWFHRDEVLPRYPQLLPYVQEVCQRLNCTVVRHKDVAAIKMLARQMQPHPQRPNTLIVDTTVVNTLPVRQAWPVVQILLTDSESRIVAAGKFLPRNYLDPAIDPDQGMPSWQNIHIRLELYGDPETASGFQIRLL